MRRTMAAPTRRAPPVTSTVLPARPRLSRAGARLFMVAMILPERSSAPPFGELFPGTLSADAHAASARLTARIAREIAPTGFMSFARFMELLLYAPGMGYYAAGSTKLGAHGDYTTAPELSPLFGNTLAAQVEQVV